MQLNDYQSSALKTTNKLSYSDVKITDPSFMIKVLGLVGESGEVAEKFKKIIRNKDGKIDETDKEEILKELGDVLWYVAVLSRYLDSDLDTLAETNLKKLTDRHNRGLIASNGDNR